MVRWPKAWVALSRAAQSLPPRSRVRRALLRRNALSGWGAWVRGDLELCLVRFSPDWHYTPPKEWLITGMPDEYRGHAGLRQWAADLREAWEFVDHTPLEVVDAGDVAAFLCKVRLRGRSTGIELDSSKRRSHGGWLMFGSPGIEYVMGHIQCDPATYKFRRLAP